MTGTFIGVKFHKEEKVLRSEFVIFHAKQLLNISFNLGLICAKDTKKRIDDGNDFSLAKLPSELPD